MLAIVIGLVLIVTVAAGIVAMVAAPRLRGGEELLTPEGKQTIIRAGQRTREQSAAAAENTVQAVSSLKGRVSSAWSPASEFLHQQLDRLEGQEGTVNGPSGETGSSTADSGSSPTARHNGGMMGVGAPRPVPAESGPIPIDDSGSSSADSGTASAAPGADGPPVINLRNTASDRMRPQSATSPEAPRRVY